MGFLVWRMRKGEFVSVNGWRVWVEYEWLNLETVQEKAHHILVSGWCGYIDFNEHKERK